MILILFPAYLHSPRLLEKTPISYSCLVWPWWGAAWQPEWTGALCALKHKYHHQQHYFSGVGHSRKWSRHGSPFGAKEGGGSGKGAPVTPPPWSNFLPALYGAPFVQLIAYTLGVFHKALQGSVHFVLNNCMYVYMELLIVCLSFSTIG